LPLHGIWGYLLHDTIEDTKTTGTELRRLFGTKVAGIVAEVTDYKRLPKERRKELQIEHAGSLSQNAKQVKLADKICNLRDILASPPKDWSIERKRQYFDWAKKVIDQVRGTNLITEMLKVVAGKRHCGAMHEPSLASLRNLSLVAARAHRYGSHIESPPLELEPTHCIDHSS
jgi:hypothetical protein